MLLRSVPLVATVPVITLIAGRDVLSVTIISGIVTFFPSLVNLNFGLRSAPRQAADLITVYGGSPRTLLTKVRLPFAMASLFASMPPGLRVRRHHAGGHRPLLDRGLGGARRRQDDGVGRDRRLVGHARWLVARLAATAPGPRS